MGRQNAGEDEQKQINLNQKRWQVAKYKRLEGGIEFTEKIPKSAAGKILRTDIKAAFVQKLTEKSQKILI